MAGAPMNTSTHTLHAHTARHATARHGTAWHAMAWHATARHTTYSKHPRACARTHAAGCSVGIQGTQYTRDRHYFERCTLALRAGIGDAGAAWISAARRGVIGLTESVGTWHRGAWRGVACGGCSGGEERTCRLHRTRCNDGHALRGSPKDTAHVGLAAATCFVFF